MKAAQVKRVRQMFKLKLETSKAKDNWHVGLCRSQWLMVRLR